ncbi:MAG TPA: 1,4-dihydroxy-2-naphthoate polyprenyltransferase [Candidatus Hydrogenedentes bacterium]|nr:1,4-dihydroxy-2-naphthoate polyprenyltransferase [Candidatus Hydrogenedentota bacterium]
MADGFTHVDAWIEAARPKTLAAAVSPVCVGTAIAFPDGGIHLPAAMCALLGAVLIQIATNFANDYFDYLKGADTAERKGPLRAAQSGLVKPVHVLRASMVTFLLVFLPGTYIVWRGGWPFIAIGLLSIASGILYTAGPYPLGYTGLADLFVLVFFGPVAVVGTYYLQTLELRGAAPFVASLGPGLLSVALLTVNNLRDVDEDRKANKKTLAVRFGPGFARAEYLFCVIGACVGVPVYFYVRENNLWFMVTPAALVFLAAPAIRTVFTQRDGLALNRTLAQTGGLLLLFSILFSLGWLV